MHNIIYKWQEEPGVKFQIKAEKNKAARQSGIQRRHLYTIWLIKDFEKTKCILELDAATFK